MENTVLIVSIYCMLLASYIMTGLIKAKLHMDYLKCVNPEKYGNYKSYFSVFTFKYYDVGLQFLFFPIFYRIKEKETGYSKKLVKKIWAFLIINILLFLALVAPLLVSE